MFTLSFKTGQLYEWGGGPRPLRPTHNAAHGSHAVRKYLDFTLHRRYGVRYFLQEGLKTTRVISWFDLLGWLMPPTTWGEISLFCKPDLLQVWITMSLIWDLRSGRGTREPNEPSLPSFDKGTGKYPSFISRRNGITCLQLPSCVYPDFWMFYRIGWRRKVGSLK